MSGPNINNHPCFNVHAKGTCGRVHLPVAPDCNIKCNYCNRKYDCVNESRPGVTSSVLTPDQAVLYLERVLEKAPNITVAGIAGPGDAFAKPKGTMETLRLIRNRFPEILLCLATNGLNVAPYIAELAELQVSHVTMTVNAVDPEIGARIYSWVRDGKVIYRGIDAAKLLLARQLEAIAALKAHGIVVKGEHHRHTGDQRSSRCRGRSQDGRAWGGHPELHDHVPEPRHAVRRHWRANAGVDG